MSNKLDRILAKLDALEHVSGINPEMEVIRQRDDGTWPEPQTNADLIVEVVSFKPCVARALADRNRELAVDVSNERKSA